MAGSVGRFASVRSEGRVLRPWDGGDEGRLAYIRVVVAEERLDGGVDRWAQVPKRPTVAEPSRRGLDGPPPGPYAFWTDATPNGFAGQVRRLSQPLSRPVIAPAAESHDVTATPLVAPHGAMRCHMAPQ
ncbi:hypothetical protein [Streptomyces sp. NPDC002785]|uniref:hypothetical protein n=1 Tax=Streptomyces sp. NPDC002785 TaxID=3154543 RepID=UPI00332DD1D5